MSSALGLPEKVRACLFDLDGVLTDTASVHTKAWKAMFDAYLSDRAERTGDKFVPFDAAADYRKYVDGKKREDGVRSFLESRGIHLPDGSPRRSRRRRDRSRPGQPQERHVPGGPEATTASRCSTGRAATSRRFGTPGWASPWCRRAPTPARCSRSPAWTRSCSSGSTASPCATSTSPASPHPTPSCGRRSCSTSTADAAAVFEDALSGVEAGRAGHFGFVVGCRPGGPGRGRYAATAPTSSSPTSPSCCSR